MSIMPLARQLCSFDKCYSKCVNTTYSFCMIHMSNQLPIRNIDKPDECPICFEPDDSINNTFLHLTCGHWVHKNCIIQTGRVGCPICRQFIYLDKKTFLYVRLVNLNRKLDYIKDIYDIFIFYLLKNSLQFAQKILDLNSNDEHLIHIDNFLRLLNIQIYNILEE